MTDLKAVLEKVKSATGPDRELDQEIAFATQFRPDERHDLLGSFVAHEAKHDYHTAWIAHAPWRGDWGIPRYTASIDACAALIELKLPARWEYHMGTCGEDDMPWASITEPDEPCRDFAASAPTIPLAAIEALLSALIAIGEAP